MRNRLIIDGNAVYEVDEECLKKKQLNSGTRNTGTIGSFTGQEQQRKDASSR